MLASSCTLTNAQLWMLLCARAVQATIVVGLTCLHSQGWAHQDVKASNLLVLQGGLMVLGDLGCAAPMDASGNVRPTHTLGTPACAAPEVFAQARQLLGRSHNGAAADVFSLGATLFYMVTGRCPDHALSWRRRAALVVDRLVRPGTPAAERPSTALAHLPAGYSDELRDLMQRATQQHWASRLTLAQVASHPWFSGFDWRAFHSGAMAPPAWAAKAAAQFVGMPRPQPAPAMAGVPAAA